MQTHIPIRLSRSRQVLPEWVIRFAVALFFVVTVVVAPQGITVANAATSHDNSPSAQDLADAQAGTSALPPASRLLRVEPGTTHSVAAALLATSIAQPPVPPPPPPVPPTTAAPVVVRRVRVVRVAVTAPPAPQPAAPDTTVAPDDGQGGQSLGNFVVTCYAIHGHTATGAPAGENYVAVDPRVIPLGSSIRIGNLGVKVAADTGGAIKGNRLDIWRNTVGECRAFGRQTLPVWKL